MSEERIEEQEEVVRCKDCKHSEEWYGDKRRCFLWHESGIDVFEDGFCNYGKRKQQKCNNNARKAGEVGNGFDRKTLV